ncbi:MULTISPECIES: hypothetical protein [Aerosakkonema]|uniref:hypothetical protein n=1 Tax=Aerosakkonema TaxID=1246629 RepID=UPI0035B9E1A7
MEPAEFCLKWVKNIKPGERGYYKACVKVLSKVTGLSERTIEGWGPDFSGRPDSVAVTLRKEDILNQIRQLVKPDDLSDLLDSGN